LKVESKFENNICAHTKEIYTTRKVSPTFLQCSMSIDTWEFETILKAFRILHLDSTKFDLLLYSFRSLLSTIKWHICIQALKVLAIEEAKPRNKNPLPKVKRLEWQSTHQNNKHASVNNWLFRVNWGFRFRAKGKAKWMGKKLMKKLDEYLTWVYFGFTH
jgi:hypothetical protein